MAFAAAAVVVDRAAVVCTAVDAFAEAEPEPVEHIAPSVGASFGFVDSSSYWDRSLVTDGVCCQDLQEKEKDVSKAWNSRALATPQ